MTEFIILVHVEISFYVKVTTFFKKLPKILQQISLENISKQMTIVFFCKTEHIRKYFDPHFFNLKYFFKKGFTFGV